MVQGRTKGGKLKLEGGGGETMTEGERRRVRGEGANYDNVV